MNVHYEAFVVARSYCVPVSLEKNHLVMLEGREGIFGVELSRTSFAGQNSERKASSHMLTRAEPFW